MTYVLALDAMGGDLAPRLVLEGAEIFLRDMQSTKKSANQTIHFLIFGPKDEIQKKVNTYPILSKKCEIIDSASVITNEMKPIVAIRQGRKSSMGMAIDSVAKGQAHAVISAGNTGAYMALSKIMLKTFDGVDRPAIPAVLPTIKGRIVVLDLGANLECTIDNLVQFALLGSVYAREILPVSDPTVGLLNIGSESIKGNQHLQEASKILETIEAINFRGFVEGDDIAKGTVDVVVTDGFSGNIALKAIEGTAHLLNHLLKESLASSWRGKLGYMVARPCFLALRQKTHPSHYNGAVFLGLKKIAVKSHGGTDPLGFAHAIQVAVSMIDHDLSTSIDSYLSLYPC